MSFATCRSCNTPFKKDGWGAQSKRHPRLCKDCVLREAAYHGRHSPQALCMEAYL